MAPQRALLGLAIGLATLVRGEAIGLLLVLLVPVALQLPRGRRLARAGVALAVALADDRAVGASRNTRDDAPRRCWSPPRTAR